MLARRPDVLLCFYDAPSRTYRRLEPHWAEIVAGWQGAIDLIGRDVRRRLPRWRRWLPSRYPLVMELERRRLTTGSPSLAHAAGLAQRFLPSPTSKAGASPWFPSISPWARTSPPARRT